MASGPFFIVGVPRSGTSLLRQMLRGHPRLTIPQESHFVPAALAAATGEEALRIILADPHFLDWSIDPDAVRRHTATTDMTPPAVVRAVFETYAQTQGKPRWGDKTPGYMRHMPQLAAAFPGAQFIHIVRDGREVAASLRDASWGPTDVVLTAHQWRCMIADARRGAATLPATQYLEVHYRRLVAEPEKQLRLVLGFLGEEMAEGLLDYSARTATEQPYLPPEHRHLLEPLTPGIRDWRTGCTSSDQATIEALLAPTMRDLGFDCQVPPVWRRADAECRLFVRRGRSRAQRVLRGNRGVPAR